MPIDFKQLQEFITAIATTDITELTIKEGDFELIINKRKGEVMLPANYNPAPSTPTTVSSAVVETPAPVEPEKPTNGNQRGDNWQEITSPMVGTFYRASAPDEAPFVEIGDKVSVGGVVCIIEAMKLMNEIEAEFNGQIVEIAVENGEPVEYGQTLFWIAT